MTHRHRLLAALLIGVLACTVLAQDAPVDNRAATANLDIRLSIVESRLGRLETDVAGLSAVPSQLARIESKLEALSERSSGNSSVLQTVGVGIAMSLVSGIVAFFIGKRNAL
ncbi:MAG: hypothetical protein LC118_15630 [Dehalococcoidia bacterium]|nr:hypothetical protein [Dehalococcoidia bacterium]